MAFEIKTTEQMVDNFLYQSKPTEKEFEILKKENDRLRKRLKTYESIFVSLEESAAEENQNVL